MAKKSVKKTDVSKNVFFEEESFETIKNPIKEAMNQHTIKSIFVLAILIMLIIFFFLNFNHFISFIDNLIKILTPIILGWVLTFIMSPLYNVVVKRVNSKQNKKLKKFSKIIATIVCSFVLLVLTIGIIFLFVPQLYNSIIKFLSHLSGYITTVGEAVDSFQRNSNNDIANGFLDQIKLLLRDFTESSSNINYSAIVSSLFTGFAVSFKVVLNVFIGFIVMIYSLNMKEELLMGAKRVLFALTRKDVGKKILLEMRYAKQVFEGFFIGKVLDSLIIGVICYICCLIMKMPYTPLISVIIGLTNIIPFFGPFIGAIPTFLLILLEETFSFKPYIFLVFVLILQQIDGNIIGPKILGDRTGVGSFWVLFSIILFGGLFGFVGMIIAVPLWAVVTRLFDEFITAKLVKKHYPTSIEDYKNLKEHNKS